MAADQNVAITLTVNGQQFQAQMRQAGDSVSRFGSTAKPAAAELFQLESILKGVAGAAAAVIAAGVGIVALVNDQANAIADYQGLAEKIGDTASAIASLKLAADVSGVSLDTVASASVKLTAGLAKTEDETKGAGLAITQLGLNFDAFKQLSPVEQLDAVAKAMAGFEDNAGKTAIAVQIFGKSGAELIPFFNDLANGSERQTVLTDAQIEAADAYTKQVSRLKSEIGTMLQQASSQLIPVLSDVITTLRDVASAADGVTGAADELKSGNALRDFAQGSAVALAILAESLVGIGKTVRTVAGSFEAVFADLSIAGEFVGRGGVVGLAFEGNRKALSESLDKRNETVRQANARLKDLIEYDGARLSDALKKQFAESNAAAGRPRSAAERAARPSLPISPTAETTPAGGSSAAGAATQRAAEQSIRRQQEKNLLLETELRLGRQITGAQAELLLLNSRLAPVSSTSLQAELEKSVALESQTATLREQARLKEQVLRSTTSEVDRFFRETAPRSQGRDGIEAIRDEGDNGSRQALDQVYEQTLQNEKQALEAQLQQLNTLREQAREAGLQRDAEFDEREVQLRDQTNQRLAQADRAYQDTKDELRQQDLQRAGDFFGNLATIAQAFGKKGFAAYKAFATAQAIISTYESATKAFSSLAGVPIVGPALGAVAAGAAIVAGLANVRAIQSQQPPGREFGGPVNAGGIYEIGEGNKPELLRARGKTYLISGNQGGSVEPAQSASRVSSGGADSKLRVEVVNLEGQTSSTQRQRSSDGSDLIRIVIQQVQADIAGGGQIARQLDATYGTQRRGR